MADEDTVRGMKLAGVDGQAVSSREEALAAFESASEKSDVGILVLTDVVAAELEEEIKRFRVERAHPLVAVIPGPDGPMPGRKSLRKFVQEAVGIRVGEEEDGGGR